jgi:hypothetical protein
VSGIVARDQTDARSDRAPASCQLFGEGQRRPHRVIAACDQQYVGFGPVHGNLC